MASPAKPFTVPHFRRWASELLLDSGEPWEIEPFQAAFVRDVFAGVPEAWLIIPEGNAKTTLAAGFSLYHAQHMKGARVPVAASSRDQAEWLFQAAAGFVERSEGLARIFRCQEGYRRIRCDPVGSRIQIFAADDRTGDGVIPTLCILEELHRHRNMNLYRTWRGKLLKRGGQLMAISTGGDPTSDFEETRRAIREQATEIVTKGSHSRIVGKGIVVHEYAVPEGVSVEDLREVWKANPLKAITIPALREKRDTPTMSLSHWRRFVCGQPSSGTEAEILPAQWDALEVDIGRVTDGERVWISVLTGAKATIAIAAPRDEGKVAFTTDIYEDLSGAVTEQKLMELMARYDVQEITHDRAPFLRSAEILAGEGLPMMDAPLGGSVERQIAVSATFNRLLLEGLLMHDGDPDLRVAALAVTKKEAAKGWHYLKTVQTTPLLAVALACHQATAYSPEPMIVFPRVG